MHPCIYLLVDEMFHPGPSGGLDELKNLLKIFSSQIVRSEHPLSNHDILEEHLDLHNDD